LSPEMARSLARIFATSELNSKCHDPASCSIACLTLRLVVKGPGVNNNLSRAEAMAIGVVFGALEEAN